MNRIGQFARVPQVFVPAHEGAVVLRRERNGHRPDAAVPFQTQGLQLLHNGYVPARSAGCLAWLSQYLFGGRHLVAMFRIFFDLFCCCRASSCTFLSCCFRNGLFGLSFVCNIFLGFLLMVLSFLLLILMNWCCSKFLRFFSFVRHFFRINRDLVWTRKKKRNESKTNHESHPPARETNPQLTEPGMNANRTMSLHKKALEPPTISKDSPFIFGLPFLRHLWSHRTHPQGQYTPISLFPYVLWLLQVEHEITNYRL